ncbi:MAG: hypothetical protein HYV09_12525 [Deltaproteobacteria bacterium]|nr:hypothetical protein [Deltaproteobacteria bacterium]
MVARLVDPRFAARDEVVLERATPELAPAHVEAQTRFVRYENEHVELGVESASAGWLVLTDTFYPGWRADVDGAPAEIVAADGFARAVHLEPRRHRVRFRFVSRSLRFGLALSAVGVFVLVAIRCWRRLSSGRRASTRRT